MLYPAWIRVDHHILAPAVQEGQGETTVTVGNEDPLMSLSSSARWQEYSNIFS